MSHVEFGQILAVVTGVLLFVLAGFGLSNLRSLAPTIGWFAALSAAGAVWSLGYAFQGSQYSPWGFQAAAVFEYLGLAFLPTFWLLVAVHWMGHPLGLRWGIAGAGFVLSTTLFLVVATNDVHHGWYSAIVPLGPPGLARYVPGPWYYGGATLAVLPSLVVPALLWHKRKTISHSGEKAVFLLVSGLLPVGAAVAYQLGFRPGGLDPTVFSLVPSFLTLVWGLFIHGTTRLVPDHEKLMDHLEHPVLVYDAGGTLVDHNAAARAHIDAWEAALGPRTENHGEVMVTLGTEKRTFGFVRSPLRRTQGPAAGSVVVLSDLSAERQKAVAPGPGTNRDPLTGVANLKYFEDHALAEITRASRHGGTVALVLFDLDAFQAINATYGNDAGDRVLSTVVGVIGCRLRNYDLLARIASDRFAILLPEAHPVEAREAAERWRSALEATVSPLPGSVQALTASFGVAALNELPISLPAGARPRLDALQLLAEKALGQAKAEGRNRVC